MLSEVETPRDSLVTAAEEVRRHPASLRMAALAFDVLSRQAEGRSLFSGRDYVRSRADIHGLTTEDARSEVGNLLSILERGPETALERALVAAYAVAGFEGRIAAMEEELWPAVLGRFVRHVDWLTIASPYEVYPFFDMLLTPTHAEAVWASVADAVLVDDRDSYDGRARNAARLTALARTTSPAGSAQLRRLARELQDPAMAAMARALSGSDVVASPQPTALRVRGKTGVVPSWSAPTLIRVFTGYAILQWVGRFFAALVLFRREVELEVAAGGIHVRTRTWLLGKQIRDWRELCTWSALAGISRAARYPAIHLLIGLFALSLGILAGALFAVDGVRGGDAWLLSIAALLVFLGAGLDLVLSVLIPGRRARVALELRILPRRAIRIVNASMHDADAFLDAVEQRLQLLAKSVNARELRWAQSEPPARSGVGER